MFNLTPDLTFRFGCDWMFSRQIRGSSLVSRALRGSFKRSLRAVMEFVLICVKFLEVAQLSRLLNLLPDQSISSVSDAQHEPG